MNDGGRPAGAAIQVEASNHLKVLWTKSMVLSVKEKAVRNCQVSIEEMNDHMNRLRPACRQAGSVERQLDSIKTRFLPVTWDKLRGHLFTV